MFRPPVRATEAGIELHLPSDERSLLARLLDELGGLLKAQSEGDAVVTPEVAARLSPEAYDDPEKSAEYARLMADELLASRLGAIELLSGALAREHVVLDEASANALMRSINTIRLVLGTMLGISDDPGTDEEEEEERLADSPEYQLYNWLSWLLEWTVRSL